jgi:transcription elongation factor Elf1
MFNTLKANAEKKFKRLECPKCGGKLIDHGALSVKLQGSENESYCNPCFQRFIADNVPKLIDPMEGKDIEEVILNATPHA